MLISKQIGNKLIISNEPSDMFPRTPFIFDSSIVFSTAVRRCLIWSKIVSTCFAIPAASLRLSKSFNGTSVFKRLHRSSILDIAYPSLSIPGQASVSPPAEQILAHKDGNDTRGYS